MSSGWRGSSAAALLVAALGAMPGAGARPEAALTVRPLPDGGGVILAVTLGDRDGAWQPYANPKGPDVPGEADRTPPVIVHSVDIPVGAVLSIETAAITRIVYPEGEVVRWSGGPPDSPVVADPCVAPEVETEDLRIRDRRVVRLALHPACLNGETGEGVVALQFEVRISWEPGTGAVQERDGSEPATSPGKSPELALKIEVDREGLIRVDYDDFISAGVDATWIDPQSLEVSLSGQPIPAAVIGGEDRSFDPGDAIEFYGVPANTRFARHSVYRLEVLSEGKGLRFATRDGTPTGGPLADTVLATEHFEDGNSIYTFGHPAQEGDPHFFWAWFETNPNPPRVTALEHTAVLPGLDLEEPTATFRALLAGRTDPDGERDHRVRLSVNGTEIGESTWNGKTLHTAEIPFSTGLLGPGPNTFRIDLVPIANPDIYYLDWIEIDYPRVASASSERLLFEASAAGGARYQVNGFQSNDHPIVLDVTNPAAPELLHGVGVFGPAPYSLRFEHAGGGGRRYFVATAGGRLQPRAVLPNTPTDLRNAQNGADQIIIIPRGWESAIQPLKEHREAQGLRVVVANLEEVADEFAGGNVSDRPIRDFVRYAFWNWRPPAVAFLLLVGEPNLDGLNELGRFPYFNLMPTHYGVTDSQGETMSDTWFGAVAGNDLLPDAAVGRLSVRTPAEAAVIVTKIIDYENNATLTEDWNRELIHVASNEPGFELALESAAVTAPAAFSLTRLHRRSGASTSQIVSAFDAGAAIVSFLGHGNVQFWADNPGGPYFSTFNARNLSNTSRLPFVTALNCLNGLIGHPFSIDSLAEVLANRPDEGALAVWSPSALGVLADYEPLQDRLYHQIFAEREFRLGAAAIQALNETYLNHPVSLDLVKQMVFVGDPAGWLAIDTDDDGAIDPYEAEGGADPGDRDSDDDGLIDGLETRPRSDFDGDGLSNIVDPDSDDDGLPDGLEAGIESPPLGTDPSTGWFLGDLDPDSTTDSRNHDTDLGGAPDGAEDRNANGRIDAGETDPNRPEDDPPCLTGQPAEVAAAPESALRLDKAEGSLVLTWGGSAAEDPCRLTAIYASPDPRSPAGFRPLRLVGAYEAKLPNGPSFDAATYFLVVDRSPIGGEGVWGHYGR